MKGKIIKAIGVISTLCLATFPPIIFDGRSFVFFGELPIPEEK